MKRLLLILGLAGFAFAPGLRGQAPEPVVHAIIFYSPTCPHCHQLITEYLIPLEEELRGKLVLLGMDTSQGWANNLYWETIRHFELPEEEWVVPMMIVGDEVLIGGIRIPQRLDQILEESLTKDGVDLPGYPAMVTFFREQNILDPRYPDRLIARPAPRPEEEASGEDAGSASDSLEAQPTDSGAVVADSAPEENPAGEVPPSDDSAAGVPSPEDSAAAARVGAPGTSEAPDSTAVPGETGAAPGAGDSTAVSAGPEEREVAEPTPGGEDRISADPEATPVPGSDVPSAADSASGSASGSVSGLGMSEAIQGMETMTMMDRFNLDPAGNSISVLVLLAMVISLGLRGYPPRVKGGEWPSWVVPGLVVIGVGVAGYLSYIEVTHSQAVCGPVGDCNTVNQSEYATLFGILPVGVLGLMGYAVIMALWLIRRVGNEGVGRLATIGLWASALFGTVFSVYLTFLEPFVIGATCAWCLTSAIIMTLILWASSSMAAQVWGKTVPSSPVS